MESYIFFYIGVGVGDGGALTVCFASIGSTLGVGIAGEAGDGAGRAFRVSFAVGVGVVDGTFSAWLGVGVVGTTCLLVV